MFPSKDGGVGGCGGIRLFDWNGKKRRQEELLRQREEAREKEEAERRWREKCEAAKVLQQAIIVWGHFYRARDTTPPFKVSETSRELLWRQAPNYVLDIKGYIERKRGYEEYLKSLIPPKTVLLMDFRLSTESERKHFTGGTESTEQSGKGGSLFGIPMRKSAFEEAKERYGRREPDPSDRPGHHTASEESIR